MIEADVVVVGSGAGGAPVALTLARAGASVVVLERGPRYGREQFLHDEVRIARRSFFVPSVDTDPHVLVEDGGAPERTSDGWVASCVGGGTVHMSGFFYRFHPVDFRLRDLLGEVGGAEVANWPISYDELAPYYERVERELGVSGPTREGPFAPPRAADYPLPALQTHPVGALLDAAASRLGLTTLHTPRAIVSRPYGGRQGCVYCQLCGSFGCETGAKSSTLATLLPAAEATGRCWVIAAARALEIRVDADGRARGVVYRGPEGEDEVRARAVVVACSAVESARLLLLSQSPRHPHGLGNDEGQIGRHLCFSTLSKAHGSFRYDKDATRAELLREPSPFVGRSILDFYAPKEGPVRKAGALNFLFPSGGPIAQAELAAQKQQGLVWGPELNARLRHFFREQRQVDCETFGEYLPTPGTHVTLDPEVRDAAGLPVARITIARHAHDRQVSSYLAERAALVLREAGADEVWTSQLGGRTMHLPMGCLRMGEDRRHSAVDAAGRVHGVPNVFVSDGSVFASSGGVPPTFTILANALRVGEGIAAALGRRDL